MLKDARGKLLHLRALVGVDTIVLEVDKDRLTRTDVAHPLKTEHIDGHAFRSDHIFHAVLRFALPKDDRPDPVRVAESHDAHSRDHGHCRVAPAAALMQTSHRRKDILGIDPKLAHALQFMSEDVEQDLGIGIGVDVAQIFAE